MMIKNVKPAWKTVKTLNQIFMKHIMSLQKLGI
jgi:hypothetical protein